VFPKIFPRQIMEALWDPGVIFGEP